MINVIYSEIVESYLKTLTIILAQNAYFGDKEFAKKYVTDLIYNIETKIGYTVKRPVPKQYSYYQKNLQYITYKRNKQTSWYILFIQQQDRYLITHITNNHDPNFTTFL